MYFRMLESFLSIDSCFQKRILICLVRFIVKNGLCIKNARKINCHVIFTNSNVLYSRVVQVGKLFFLYSTFFCKLHYYPETEKIETTQI